MDDKFIINYSKWIPAYICRSCKKEVEYEHVFDSRGVCPLCGASDGSTVVDVRKTAKRLKTIKYKSWWKRLIMGSEKMWEYK